MAKVGIIGNGWVGKAMLQLFPNALVYIRNGVPNDQDTFTNDKDKINQCDVIFICVPTPNKIEFKNLGNDNLLEVADGKLDTSIVEECVSWINKDSLIVIRSTVNPGTTDHLINKYNKKIVMQPEYLGETPNHPLLNTKDTPFLIMGGDVYNTRILINLYATVYNANVKIRQVTPKEAEIIKILVL